ncbi:phytoene desaturase family protein [Coralloluteibacterium stylophorae]|uniref:Pyridine nucleotide-disulfide oxidoreductase domain-containing protein 2 n=1 Tax=Coralloluteibacterium stylophorae TaxID=1776034 RepID=A0A8J7VVX7_9GAMM|nr:NAD(P)/FAD-dependent oxidoreductase [Coralloluteibacterium stylophorae]MBS7458485.1 NAD(P)/FAD-dependent oxidoreductase [Coralloluteibacterium stylophorae]
MHANGDCDVLVIGGGHNGLVCAAYLAGAGLRVRVLERRAVLGGAAVTEEFHPGFRNSSCSYTVGLLAPEVIAELRLREHGLRIVERPFANFLPLPDGRAFRLGGGDAQAQVAAFSRRDAGRLPDYFAMLERVVEVLRVLTRQVPPNVSDRFVLADWLASASVARRLKGLDMRGRRDLLDLLTKSAGEVLDAWFEAAPLKAALGWDAVVGHFASPYTPGSAYVLLHHVFGEVDGKPGAWGHAIGGMGAVSDAIAAEAQARGVTCETGVDVAEVLVEDGRACGVRTADGRVLRARAVAAALNPKLLYQRLVAPAHLDPDLRARFDRYRCGSGTFRMNVALAELPDFTAAPGTALQPHHQAGILIGDSLEYFERAYFDARSREHNPGWARAPIVELVIASALDDGLAPRGAHVASLFCQHVNPTLAEGWDAHRDTVARLMIDTVDRVAPNFARSVLGYRALSPLDLEREYGLVGGDIFHGALGLDQLFSARPVLGQADHRGALAGLYLCGSGTHPGGGVTGLPGRNAAGVIRRDLGRR